MGHLLIIPFKKKRKFLSFSLIQQLFFLNDVYFVSFQHPFLRNSLISCLLFCGECRVVYPQETFLVLGFLLFLLPFYLAFIIITCWPCCSFVVSVDGVIFGFSRSNCHRNLSFQTDSVV